MTSPFHLAFLIGLLGLCFCEPSSAAYTVSVYLPLSAPSLGELPNCEGLAVAKKSKSLVATRYYNGSIFEVTSSSPTNGSAAAFTQQQLFNPAVIQGQLTGIKVNHRGQRYVCLHSTNPLHNGVWRVDEGVSNCASIDAPGCVKIFPRQNESVLFPDGVAIVRHGNKYRVFVSDPPSGNIWVMTDEGKNTKAQLFAGTDAGSVPNFLQGMGILFPLGSDFNPIGRGFGANGLAYDEVNDKLYVAVAETALVVSIKVHQVRRDQPIAGTQTVVGGQGFFLKYILDGVFYENGVVYTTAVADLSTGGLLAGQKVLAINLKQPTPTWTVLIDDVLLGTPTDIVSGCGFEHPNANCDKLYITDIAGFGLSRYGPNILVATKTA